LSDIAANIEGSALIGYKKLAFYEFLLFSIDKPKRSFYFYIILTGHEKPNQGVSLTKYFQVEILFFD
jgi:hypothetical protein